MKKNHFITHVLIALTTLVVVASSFFHWRSTPQKPSTPKAQEPVSHDTGKMASPSVTKNWCLQHAFQFKNYIVCKVNPTQDTIRLFLNDDSGKPFHYFRNVVQSLKSQKKTLAFAMNAGMYHKDYSAVGLYIENAKELYPVSTREGPGNFHMMPNGIFFIEDGKAYVRDTQSYLKETHKPDIATQSGPMLVINNEIHPRFIPNSPFLEYRNGVGVDGHGMVYFVISQTKVNFDEMARFFRDILKTPNALFLDGSISSLYAPEINRYDWWYALGPIIGVVIDTPPDP